MIVQILTPTESLFDGEADSVIVPGKNGAFQMKNKHAPIVSTLVQGKVKLFFKENLKINLNKLFEEDKTNSKVFNLSIKGGIMEMNNNKVIILCD